MDYFFNYCFILECLLKVITHGFFICETSYLRDPWSCLDFFIVVSSTIDMMFEDFNYPFIKILRIFQNSQTSKVSNSLRKPPNRVNVLDREYIWNFERSDRDFDGPNNVRDSWDQLNDRENGLLL